MKRAKKRVKAWAVLYKNRFHRAMKSKLGAWMITNPESATEALDWKIVPCTIEFTLPPKEKRK